MEDLKPKKLRFKYNIISAKGKEEPWTGTFTSEEIADKWFDKYGAKQMQDGKDLVKRVVVENKIDLRLNQINYLITLVTTDTEKTKSNKMESYLLKKLKIQAQYLEDVQKFIKENSLQIQDFEENED